MFRLLMVLMLVVALAMSPGCTSDRPLAGPVVTTLDTTDGSPEEALAEPSAATAIESVGLVRYDGSAYGFSVLLPEDWVVIDAHDVDLGEGFEAFGDAMPPGLEDQAFAAFDQGGALFAFDVAGSSPGFLDNINIIHGPAWVSDAAAVETMTVQQLGAFGAVDVVSEVSLLPAGEAVFVWYRLPTFGNEGISVTIITEDEHWTMTLSATDVDPLEAMFDAVVESFHEVP